MSRLPRPSRASQLAPAILALAAFVALPAMAELPPAVPLEAPQPLPESPGQGAHTPPDVVLRPDGGMIAVWSDVIFVLGRWFGPVDSHGDSLSGGFVLREASGLFNHVPRVARGSENTYLAVWLESAYPELILTGRAFDGEGRPLAPAREIAPTRSLDYDLAALPSGGYALAYLQPVGTGASADVDARLLLLEPDGSPAGPSIQVADRIAGAPLGPVHVAADPDGTIAVTWSRTRGDLTSRVFASVFSGAIQPSGPAVEVVPAVAGFGGIEHDVAAVGQDVFLLVWAGNPLTPSHPRRTVYAVDFDASGPRGIVPWLDAGGSPNGSVSMPSVAAGPDGQAVVAWVDERLGRQRPVARPVAPTGLPSGPIFDVDAEVPEDHLVNRISADRGADGLLAFGWGTGHVSPFFPIASNFFETSSARRFRTETACSPLDSLAFHTEPLAPTEDDAVRLVFDTVGECITPAVEDWSRQGARIRVNLPVQHGICDPPETFERSAEVGVGELPSGEYEVDLDVSFDGLPACSRGYAFTVDEAPPPPPPPPPDVPPLSSSELPGFQVWVAIGGDPTSPVYGASEAECVPETLCISGRVPGRSEVFVRIPGPKPNGLLWPTLVKLTTSEVQVWIEQASTGAMRYYRLEGARPGFDELPGLFDRHGFEP